jgi:hypothetical protein
MDVVGLPVEDARARLQAAGWKLLGDTPTQPPRRPLGEGTCRVVRQRSPEPGALELITAVFPEVAPASAPPPAP